jgi:hypothetical protein
MKSVKSAHSCTIKIPRTIPATTPTEKIKSMSLIGLCLPEIIACLSRGRSRGDWRGSDRPNGHQKRKDDSDYFKARVLTGNPGTRAHSSLGCLFFLRHRELQRQSLVFWLRRHTPHILSYRLHHYGRGKRLLHVRSIAGTSLPISLIAGHNSCPRAFHLAHLHLVAVHGSRRAHALLFYRLSDCYSLSNSNSQRRWSSSFWAWI